MRLPTFKYNLHLCNYLCHFLSLVFTVGKLLVVLSHELLYIFFSFYTLCRHLLSPECSAVCWLDPALRLHLLVFSQRQSVSAGGGNAVSFVLSVSLFYLCSLQLFCAA